MTQSTISCYPLTICVVKKIEIQNINYLIYQRVQLELFLDQEQDYRVYLTSKITIILTFLNIYFLNYILYLLVITSLSLGETCLL